MSRAFRAPVAGPKQTHRSRPRKEVPGGAGRGRSPRETPARPREGRGPAASTSLQSKEAQLPQEAGTARAL